MSAPRMYKTEAVILRQRRLGEADRILCIYTPAYGKMDVKARGVRKTTSRMSGHLQPLTRCMLQLAQGHVNDVVAGCETLESFQPLRENLDRLSRGLYAAEDLDQTLRFFEMRLLDQCGFRPELEACSGCGSRLEAVDNSFAPISGGVVCHVCAGGIAGAGVLSLNGLKVLRLLQHGSYNDAMRVRIEGPLAREVETHLRSFIVSVLERDVNAAAFIERLRREGARHAVEA